MIPLRTAAPKCITVAALWAFASMLGAQSTPASIEQKLDADYTVSKATADNSDIVTAGAVLVLEKDGLIMSATSTGTAAQNTYKDGKLSKGVWGVTQMKGFHMLASHGPSSTNVQTRTFVAGEKFFVTKITVHDDSVVMNLLSDPFSDVRYYATLKFPLNKGSLPTPEQVDATVGEVVKVQADDASADKGSKSGAPEATAAAAAPPAPMAPIAPPPPPADAPPPTPKTIALKQTKDQVIANFGQPTKVVKLGAKEIDYFPDMKVTFVNNKVTDIQ